MEEHLLGKKQDGGELEDSSSDNNLEKQYNDLQESLTPSLREEIRQRIIEGRIDTLHQIENNLSLLKLNDKVAYIEIKLDALEKRIDLLMDIVSGGKGFTA